MSKPLNTLIIEDSEDDVLLLLRELRHGGFEPAYERVETAEAMEAAIRRKPWDVILSDYLMPKFSGLAAIAIVQKAGLDVPFIIVSGNIGEVLTVFLGPILGLPLPLLRPRHISEVRDDGDLVVTVCDNAREACPVFPKPIPAIHLPFHDPHGEPLESFLAVRDDIRTRLVAAVREKLGLQAAVA